MPSDITPPDKERYVTDPDTAATGDGPWTSDGAAVKGLLARHEALLGRVAVLERALEQIADPRRSPTTAGGMRIITRKALNG